MDAQLTNPVAEDGSSTYELSGAASFTLKAVHAEFRDAGAGSDWLPAVVMTSKAGLPIGTAADQGVKVTAGSDADVTWFPGSISSSASPVTSTPNLPWCVAEGDLPDNGTPATYFDFATVDGTMFALDGTSQHVLILQTGLYLVLMSASYSDAVTPAATVFALDGSFGSGGTKTYLQLTSSNDSVAEGLNAGGANNTWNVEQWFLLSVTAVTTGLRCVPALTSNPHAGVSADSYVFVVRLNVDYPGGL